MRALVAAALLLAACDTPCYTRTPSGPCFVPGDHWDCSYLTCYCVGPEHEWLCCSDVVECPARAKVVDGAPCCHYSAQQLCSGDCSRGAAPRCACGTDLHWHCQSAACAVDGGTD